MDFSSQYIQIQNSVIRVLATTGQGGNHQIVSSGSGVLIDNGTKALTCSHCIVPNTMIVGALSGQNIGQIANVIYNDPVMDIAVLEFQQIIGPGVALGDSNNVLIGQEAFVVGFPSHTTTISALGANIAGFEANNGNQLIMIDASVNHGNSGGPLFNSNGELIGIVNAKFGNLSQFLNQVQQANPQAAMVIGGINPVQVIQQLIGEMKKNLNLGMGSAIPLSSIGNATNLIANLIP
ncbi:S1 family peptidase [Flavobacterium soli]|uniref:S1 family peptidase n=1 Tax=Flavobacterium soli TaxID=344881 RepID=UPI00040BBD58|nr:serine protease [Flavobacterium soli]